MVLVLNRILVLLGVILFWFLFSLEPDSLKVNEFEQMCAPHTTSFQDLG